MLYYVHEDESISTEENESGVSVYVSEALAEHIEKNGKALDEEWELVQDHALWVAILCDKPRPKSKSATLEEAREILRRESDLSAFGLIKRLFKLDEEMTFEKFMEAKK
jgi:hypothetical protein